jgi:hypothetical protein
VSVLLVLLAMTAVWALSERALRRATKGEHTAALQLLSDAESFLASEKREHAKTADALIREQQRRADLDARLSLSCAVCRVVAAPHRVSVN